MFAFEYDLFFYYAGKVECQLDPIETQKQGHDVWLLPANCTFTEPPEEKEGYRIKWNGENWDYEKIEEQEETNA